MRIAILGGGVAGVVLARELAQQKRYSIDLIEQQSQLGGLQRSKEIGGVHYDIGAFVFKPDHELFRTFPFLYNSVVPIDHRCVVLTSHHTIDKYPMTMRGYIGDNGWACLVADAIDLLRSKVKYRKRDSLVAYVKYYLGGRVYYRSGLKAYIERFYAVPDTDVDIEFAYQRLSGLPQECSLRKALGKIIRDALDPDVVNTAWRCYVRPKEGFPYMYSLIETALREDGVNIRFNAQLDSISRHGSDFVVRTDDGITERYDHVISTIPVKTAMNAIGHPMPGPLSTTRLTSLCYRFRGDLGFRNANIIYNFTYHGNWKRLILFSKQYGQDNGDDYFVVECTQRPDDTRTPEEHRRLFEQDVRGLPILNGELDYQGLIVSDDAYPFFYKEELARVQQAKQVLTDFGLILNGRQGNFLYTNAHETAVNARVLANEFTAAEAQA